MADVASALTLNCCLGFLVIIGGRYRVMLGKILFATGILSLTCLLLLVQVYNPSQAGPSGVLFVFVFTYIFIVCIFSFLFYSMSRLFLRLLTRVGISKNGIYNALSMRHSYYYATVFSLAPVMIMGLQSVGGVGFYEFILVATFLVLGSVYVAKRAT